ARLESAGLPVVRIVIAAPYQLGQEFFRWEIATAVAGAVLGINPFDQPDVEASKVKTRELMQAYERAGSAPAETPLFEQDGVIVFANGVAANAVNDREQPLAQVMRQHLTSARPGDYFALLAYIAQADRYKRTLQEMRRLVRDKQHVATCLGFGPRFLHS